MKQKTMRWHNLPTKELKALIDLSKMPAGTKRLEKIKSTPWLKKGGIDYDTDGFRMRVLERVRSLREKLQTEAKARLARFSNPVRRKPQRASGQPPLLLFLITTAKQRDTLRRLTEEFPTSKWDENTWRTVMSETEAAAKLHTQACKKLNI